MEKGATAPFSLIIGTQNIIIDPLLCLPIAKAGVHDRKTNPLKQAVTATLVEHRKTCVMQITKRLPTTSKASPKDAKVNNTSRKQKRKAN